MSEKPRTPLEIGGRVRIEKSFHTFGGVIFEPGDIMTVVEVYGRTIDARGHQSLGYLVLARDDGKEASVDAGEEGVLFTRLAPVTPPRAAVPSSPPTKKPSEIIPTWGAWA